MVLVTPSRKHLALALSSRICSGNPHNVTHAKHRELANLTGGRVLVGESAADELMILPTRRVGEHRDLRRDSALYQVRSFECPGTACVKGNDDDVRRRDRFSYDEGPARSSQDRLTNGGNTDDESHDQYDHYPDLGPSWPSKAHARFNFLLTSRRGVRKARQY